MQPPAEFARLTLEGAGFDVQADVWHGGDRAHVLLLHGLGGNSITWHGVAPGLASALGARVVALDLPGFGASRPGRAPIRLGHMNQFLRGVLRDQAPEGARWIIAGNSLGGLLALGLACQRPEQVAQVTLASLALPLGWGRRTLELAGLRQYGVLAVPWLGRRLVTRYVTARGVPGVVDDPIRLLFRDPARLDPELRQRLIAVSEYRLGWAAEAAHAYERATRSIALTLLLPRLRDRWIRGTRCPVLSIYGSHDPLYPESAWQRLLRTRPDWEHVRLEDIGHVPQLEAPQLFLEHMLRALRGMGF